MARIVLFFLLFCFSISVYTQESIQSIRGQVIDESSQTPISFANLIILDSEPLIGTTSDIDGRFLLENIPVGRYNIQASFIGYEPVIVTDILLTAAKEVNLTIALRENLATLDEVVITPRVQKEKSLNRMATVSAKMLSVEEANRYAGGFDDPARLASSFAGVASNVGNNAIIIRGNAPKFTQWKMEGIEIPNPNHFANLGAFGGGGLTALSSNLLANSDFFTGAFPAEYNNALAGVFDMRMRSGNVSKHEHSAEIGLIGIDFASEGPLNNKKNSSYLVNYRYSTLGLISSLLPEDAQGTNYQDLAFKLNFNTKKLGRFSFWGLGLIDNSGTTAEKDSNLWVYDQDKENEDAKQFMGAAGINHRLFFKNNAYLNSTIAISTSGLKFKTDRLDSSFQFQPENIIENTDYTISFKTYFNKKFSKKHTNRTGINLMGMNYDLLLKEANETNTLETLVSEKGFSTLISGFSNSTFTFKNLTLNIGLNSQLFTLNNNYTIEPRLGLSYELNKNNKLSFGYGLHSRIEQLHTYFTKSQGAPLFPNKELDFSKAHHFVLGYDWNISDNLHLRIEPYYQHLFDIPIVANTTTSLINLEKEWFSNDTYINDGIGRNYGIDLTLEKYIHNGFYYLISASVFNSEYQTDTNIWYNTRFNRNYLVNALAGKEFLIGKKKQNLLSLNLRLSLQGGDRYSLINSSLSDIDQDVVYNETTPFTEQTKNSFVSHVTLNYQWNRKRITQKLSFKVINANNFKEFLGHRYNLKTQSVEEYREALFIPNLSYKIHF
ncbi:TonB-dependent receptor [Aquimarina sediminis]|uniref:TonB-dependent receptor n=1 Tax=Aquimarina sediminis TaxID=2070536 RepID=UPI000CA01607|nr:TonB-dependent receptor [Aquimarina sediminis]